MILVTLWAHKSHYCVLFPAGSLIMHENALFFLCVGSGPVCHPAQQQYGLCHTGPVQPLWQQDIGKGWKHLESFAQVWVGSGGPRVNGGVGKNAKLTCMTWISHSYHQGSTGPYHKIVCSGPFGPCLHCTWYRTFYSLSVWLANLIMF